ncbi:MAG: cache domain-containing protein [Desulfobacterales bacterium]|nr:cache domain-containing protein [Desulfobacterales bacterium]
MGISKELNVIIMLCMITGGIVCIGVSIGSLKNFHEKDMQYIQTQLMEERMTQLKQLVANAYSVLETSNFYENAQKTINDMRFGDHAQHRFFVLDLDGLFYVYPEKPEVVGKVKMDLVDAEGKHYIKEILSSAQKHGQGFIQYKENIEKSSNNLLKLVHFKLYKKWNWIVCAGIYIDDIERVIVQKQMDMT